MADAKDTKIHQEYADAHSARLASATKPEAVSVVVNPLQVGLVSYLPTNNSRNARTPRSSRT